MSRTEETFEVKVIDRDGAEQIATSQNELDQFMRNGAVLANAKSFTERYNRVRARLLGRTRHSGTRRRMRQEAQPHPFGMLHDENGTPFRRRIEHPNATPTEPTPVVATRAQRLAQFRVENPGATKAEFRAHERRYGRG